MNKQKELAKNTLILTFGKICTQFVSFMLLPLYTALLVPEEFGVVDLINTYVTLLVPLFNWQFENGLFRFMLDCRENKPQQKKIFSTVMLSNVGQSIIYLFFFIIFQGKIHSYYKIFLAINVVEDIFLCSLLQFPRGLGHNVSYAVGSFISASSTVLLNVVLIAVIHLGANGMFLATVISKILTIGYLMISQKAWEYFSISEFNKDEFKRICKYSFPLVPNSLSWWVIGASNRSVISFALSVAANGIFSVANKFSSVFITFYNIFNMSWTESVSLHLSDNDRDSFLTETINSMFRLFSAVCFGIIACMPFVFPLMINPRYADAYPQIPILMIAVLFQVVVGLYSVIYVALKRSVEIAKTSVYSTIVNLVVDIVLIKFVGLFAASFSTLAAYATMAIYRYFDIKKYVNAALEKRLLVSTCCIGIWVLISYYYNHFITNVITLLVVIVYSLVINLEFIIAVFRFVNYRITGMRQRKIV